MLISISVAFVIGLMKDGTSLWMALLIGWLLSAPLTFMWAKLKDGLCRGQNDCTRGRGPSTHAVTEPRRADR